MIIEGNRQTAFLKAADGLNLKRLTHITHLAPCPGCLNTIQKISGVHRAIGMSEVVIQATINLSVKSRPDQ